VLVQGRDRTGQAAHRFARAGVAHAPEGRSVFATLTIQENLTLSIRQQRGRRGVGAGLERAYELFPRLAERRHQLGGSLSGGEQRMLSMARVLVDAPALLIADELSLGLAPRIVAEVYAALRRLTAEGTALLVIEQHVAHALELCDRVVLLDHGRVAWAGPSSDARDRVRAQLGV
jgi:branched-chain amino acid transport system ATP-binding protein